MTEPSWPGDRRVTVRDLQAATDRGERWAMLTSYDALTAGSATLLRPGGPSASAPPDGPGRSAPRADQPATRGWRYRRRLWRQQASVRHTGQCGPIGLVVPAHTEAAARLPAAATSAATRGCGRSRAG